MMDEIVEEITPEQGEKTAQAGTDIGKVGDADAECMKPEVGMTMAVEGQNWNEHFNILDLKMQHQECDGGGGKPRHHVGRAPPRDA